MTPILQLEDLGKSFGAHQALNALSLALAPGELFVLLGASGSGKTTLLRCIGGFETPDSGRILLNGTDITALPPHRRAVNTMFQNYALFPHMSVAENIAFGPRQAGLSKAEAASRVTALLDLVQLPGFGPRRPAQLSGGQRQRVALARALARGPSLLLLDEPFSALDRNLREDTSTAFHRIQRATAIAAIMVTHDQEEALALADRIGVMQAGTMAQIGPPREIYERPASRFVAEFMGNPNFLPAIVRERGRGTTLLRLTESNTAIRSTLSAPLGTQVLLALRPEFLTINGQAENQISAGIETIIYRGAALDITARISPSTTLLVRHPLSGQTAPPPQPGDTVTLSFPAEAAVPVTS